MTNQNSESSPNSNASNSGNLPQVIMFYGPPGSGKGTQANLLKDRFQMKFLDWGAEFREFVAVHKDRSGDPEQWRAQRVYDYLLTGPILTKDLQYIIGKAIVDGITGNRHFVMDKCGVLPAESEWLSSLLRDQNISSVLFHLPLNPKTSVERLQHRYYVPGDKFPYPSYQEALLHCQEGQTPIQREGEDEQKTLTRYDSMYRNNRDEILSIYRSKQHTKVIDIDANLSIDQVHQIVMQHLA